MEERIPGSSDAIKVQRERRLLERERRGICCLGTCKRLRMRLPYLLCRSRGQDEGQNLTPLGTIERTVALVVNSRNGVLVGRQVGWESVGCGYGVGGRGRLLPSGGHVDRDGSAYRVTVRISNGECHRSAADGRAGRRVGDCHRDVHGSRAGRVNETSGREDERQLVLR